MKRRMGKSLLKDGKQQRLENITNIKPNRMEMWEQTQLSSSQARRVEFWQESWERKEETLAPLTGFKIKLQLANLFNTDLGKGKHCGRQLCPPCDGSVEEKKQDCRAINLMYKSSCTIFNAENGNIQKDDKGRSREEVYISETSIHERSKEHLAFEVPYCETFDVVPPRGGLHGRI